MNALFHARRAEIEARRSREKAQERVGEREALVEDVEAAGKGARELKGAWVRAAGARGGDGAWDCTAEAAAALAGASGGREDAAEGAAGRVWHGYRAGKRANGAAGEGSGSSQDVGGPGKGGADE